MQGNTEEKIRICMLVHNHYLRDPRVRKEAESLVSGGFSVDVISLCEPESVRTRDLSSPKIFNGVRIHEVNLAKKRGTITRYLIEYLAMLWIGTWKILRMHLRRKFDVIHIHNMPDFLVFAGIIPKMMGSKLVLDIHDPMVELYTSILNRNGNFLLLRVLAMQERLCCRLADKVVSVNETMRENLETKGIPASKIFILNNFPDLKLFPRNDRPATLHKPENQWTLLFTGSITDHYDLEIAVRAVAAASLEIPSIMLRIVGDGNKKAEILKTAEILGITQRVKISPSVPFEKVCELMKEADVGISSHKAGMFGDLYFSTKIVEYMTQGLPVICSRTRTVEKYIPENCIFYFEPGNYKDMARQIIAVYRDCQMVAEKTEAAMRLVPFLSWEQEKPKFLLFYSDLLGRDLWNPGPQPSKEDKPTKQGTFHGRDLPK